MTQRSKASLIQSIVQLNNHGAVQLEHGNPPQALMAFAKAFEEAREFVDLCHFSGRCEACTEVSHSPCLVGDSCIDSWMTPPLNHDQNEEFVYHHPMFFPPSYNGDGLMVSVGVTFNLGLAYNAQALMEQDIPTRQQFMLQAVKLYQYSFRLQRTSLRPNDAPLYFLATINNIGVIYAQLGKRSCAEECFDQILQLLMYMSTSGFRHDVESYEGFFHSTLRIQREARTICAGAA